MVRRRLVATAASGVTVMLLMFAHATVSQAAAANAQLALVTSDSVVRVTGSGFPGSSPVKLIATMGGGRGEASVTSDTAGRLTLAFRAPAGASGAVKVTATSGQAIAAAQIVVTPAATPVPTTTGTRNIYAWPFAWNSIWNLPLSRSAQLAPAGMDATDVYIDSENISLDPTFPIKTIDAGSVDATPASTISVHSDPELSADGGWNNCSVFLTTDPDKITFVQGQPLTMAKGGNGKWDDTQPAQKLTGPGTTGCHGGSGLAGLGGDIRGGELTSGQPIRHAIKVGLDCMNTCSQANDGHRWPATKHDGGWDKPGDGNYYGGQNPQVQMGSLLAIAPGTDLSFITNPDVRKVAIAMQTYGAYVVDTTATSKVVSIDVQHGHEDEFPNINSEQMVKVFNMLQVVVNNTAATPGGGPLGSARLAPCAPPFQDGTGGAPAGC